MHRHDLSMYNLPNLCPKEGFSSTIFDAFVRIWFFFPYNTRSSFPHTLDICLAPSLDYVLLSHYFAPCSSLYALAMEGIGKFTATCATLEMTWWHGNTRGISDEGDRFIVLLSLLDPDGGRKCMSAQNRPTTRLNHCNLVPSKRSWSTRLKMYHRKSL
jgi:hypothetical protein